MSGLKYMAALVAATSLITVLAACDKQGEGPVEQAGKSVDQTAEQAGLQIEKAGKAIQGTAKGEDR